MFENFSHEKQIGIALIIIFGYMALPMVYTAYMYYLLMAGAFPPDSDAIAIPIILFTGAWYLIALVVSGVLGAILLIQPNSRLR